MMTKMDRRTKRTRMQLQTALAKLMRTESLSKITVTQIVEEADINRSTFYLHYDNIFHMVQCIETFLIGEIKWAINENLHRPTPSVLPFIESIFMILEEQQDICRALLSAHGDASFANRIEDIIRKNTLQVFAKRFVGTPEDIEYCYEFYINGCVGLMKKWLNSSSKASPAHMALITYKMIESGLEPETGSGLE